MAAQFPASSGSSSRSGASSCRRRRCKPIPYRLLSFDYEPAIFCLCGEKMPQLIAWTDGNTGRRFRNCKIRSVSLRAPPSEFLGARRLLNFCSIWFIYRFFLCQIDGGVGCNLFQWVDDPLDKYQQDLVRDLRDAVWDRDDEIERLQEEILLLAGRKQCNDELKNQALKNQAMKMQADGGNSLFIVWVLSVAFAIYCTWVMCSN